MWLLRNGDVERRSESISQNTDGRPFVSARVAAVFATGSQTLLDTDGTFIETVETSF